MNREELKNFINEIRKNVSNKHLSIFIKRHYKNEYEEIINKTNYLLINCSFAERVCNILNNLYEISKCKECKKNHINFINLNRKYHEFCSIFCSRKNIETQEKYKKSLMEKLGVDHPSKSEEIKKKKIGTCLKNHGVENPSQSEEIKEKARQSNLERRGVRCSFQSEEVKEKSKQTNLEKRGVEYAFQSEEVKEKSNQRKLEKYGNKNYHNIEKAKKTKLRNEYYKLFNSDRLKKLVIPLFTVDEYEGTKSYGERLYYSFKCTKCNNNFIDGIYDGRIPRCHNCFPTEQFTKPHKAISKFLNKNNIDHEIEKYIKPYSVDIFTQSNKIIEVYGDYWHANPIIFLSETIMNYPDGKLLAKDKWLKDEKRINYLKNKGNEILIIWEDEVNNDWNNVQNKVLEFINKKE